MLVARDLLVLLVVYDAVGSQEERREKARPRAFCSGDIVGGSPMSQAEAFSWLAVQRLTGCDEFFSVVKIWRGIQSNGGTSGLTNLSTQVTKLAECGFLEFKIKGKLRTWRRVYRLSGRYLLPSNRKRLLEAVSVDNSSRDLNIETSNSTYKN